MIGDSESEIMAYGLRWTWQSTAERSWVVWVIFCREARGKGRKRELLKHCVFVRAALPPIDSHRAVVWLCMICGTYSLSSKWYGVQMIADRFQYHATTTVGFWLSGWVNQGGLSPPTFTQTRSFRGILKNLSPPTFTLIWTHKVAKDKCWIKHKPSTNFVFVLLVLVFNVIL